ncbi:hypothetical protein F5Y16DRAFT_422781 [Xylariaceae sp. FL0255]|nr:hypothetical protein F5Y16DRAFT_422781 [Xylariaceae sp. FL0255]
MSSQLLFKSGVPDNCTPNYRDANDTTIRPEVPRGYYERESATDAEAACIRSSDTHGYSEHMSQTSEYLPAHESEVIPESSIKDVDTHATGLGSLRPVLRLRKSLGNLREAYLQARGTSTLQPVPEGSVAPSAPSTEGPFSRFHRAVRKAFSTSSLREVFWWKEPVAAEQSARDGPRDCHANKAALAALEGHPVGGGSKVVRLPADSPLRGLEYLREMVEVGEPQQRSTQRQSLPEWTSEPEHSLRRRLGLNEAGPVPAPLSFVCKSSCSKQLEVKKDPNRTPVRPPVPAPPPSPPSAFPPLFTSIQKHLRGGSTSSSIYSEPHDNNHSPEVKMPRSDTPSRLSRATTPLPPVSGPPPNRPCPPIPPSRADDPFQVFVPYGYQQHADERAPSRASVAYSVFDPEADYGPPPPIPPRNPARLLPRAPAQTSSQGSLVPAPLNVPPQPTRAAPPTPSGSLKQAPGRIIYQTEDGLVVRDFSLPHNRGMLDDPTDQPSRPTTSGRSQGSSTIRIIRSTRYEEPVHPPSPPPQYRANSASEGEQRSGSAMRSGSSFVLELDNYETTVEIPAHWPYPEDAPREGFFKRLLKKPSRFFKKSSKDEMKKKDKKDDEPETA